MPQRRQDTRYPLNVSAPVFIRNAAFEAWVISVLNDLEILEALYPEFSAPILVLKMRLQLIFSPRHVLPFWFRVFEPIPLHLAQLYQLQVLTCCGYEVSLRPPANVQITPPRF